MTDADGDLWICLEVIQQHFKGKPIGIPVEQIQPGCAYVVDWRPLKRDDTKSVSVEIVVSVDRECGSVRLLNGAAVLNHLAELVLSGPFKI